MSTAMGMGLVDRWNRALGGEFARVRVLGTRIKIGDTVRVV